VSNRNEYQEYLLGGKGGRCVGLTTLPPSCADCIEFLEAKPPGTLWACPGGKWDCFTFIDGINLKKKTIAQRMKIIPCHAQSPQFRSIGILSWEDET